MGLKRNRIYRYAPACLLCMTIAYVRTRHLVSLAGRRLSELYHIVRGDMAKPNGDLYRLA